MIRALAAIAAVALGGCEVITDSFKTNDFSGDPYPTEVELDDGAVVVGVRQAGAPDRAAVLDLLSPLTLIDPGPDASPSVTTADLLVLGRDAAGALAVPRARLSGARVVELHPCTAADATCLVGPAATPRPFEAIIGADALAGDAVRLRLGAARLSILADVAGDEQERGAACDAVFSSPYRGGGTLVVAGTELPFSGRRVTLQVCLDDDPDPDLPESERGVDALMLVSTSIGPSLLGEAAYARFRAIRPGAPALDALPEDTVYLPSGPVTGRRTTIARLALVARSSSTPRAPCRHVFGHHLLLQRDCAVGEDCPCEGGDRFCAIPAMVELAPAAGLDVLVIPDDNPTLLALRTELRPDQPEVDGILGTSALTSVELDIDYPNDRVLGRCTAADCTTRPALPERESRSSVRACIAAGPVP